MMKKCVFTIVAQNYIGLGHILEKSIKFHNEDIDFFIFVADEISNNNIEKELNILIAKNILGYSEQLWKEMTFKYDLTEFCTAIKPRCFKYMFQKGYDKAIYLDPDIYTFAPLDEVYDILNNFDIALTPQVAGIHINYQGEHPEWAMNVNGIFNLGFCAIKKTKLSNTIIEWWEKRLQDNCFMDRSVGNFTDQKWIDWLPGLLGNEHLYIFHNLGMNMAPWNFFERELFEKAGKLMVRYRTKNNPYREDELIFIHFAGYDYQKLKNGIISRKRIENLQEYTDLSLATSIYCNAMVENKHIFDKFINNKYSYSTFNNGERIASFHRRLYHGLLEEGKVYENPFSIDTDSLYAILKKKRMLPSDNIDKLTPHNLPNIDRKKQQINIFFKCIYKLFGYKRYVLFLKSLYNYCRPELHTFLIKK